MSDVGAMDLMSLGDDEMERVLQLSDPMTLGRLKQCCCRLSAMLGQQRFIQRLGQEHGFPNSPPMATMPADRRQQLRNPQFYFALDAIDSIEALALADSVLGIGSHHIIFHLASLSITHASKRLLGEYAGLMKRHRRLKLRIDSHTGVGAPPGIAPQHSQQRAIVAAKYLVMRGVPASRIVASAWGMRVGVAHNWPAAQEYARVEVSLALTDDLADDDDFPIHKCIPTRPAYYDEIEPTHPLIERTEYDAGPNPSGAIGASDEDDDSDSSSDDAPGNGIGLLQLLSQFQVRPAPRELDLT